MLKLWKVNAKAGDATVKYPFAPFPTNKDMRGKPVNINSSPDVLMGVINNQKAMLDQQAEQINGCGTKYNF